MKEINKIIIIGGGGLGREIASMVRDIDGFEHIGYIDDNKVPGSFINGVEVLGGIDFINDNTANSYNFVLGIGSPLVKRELINDLERFNLNFPNIIHPNASIQSPDYVKLGKGNVICNGSILTTNISIGDFNLINLSCTIGHDTVIENYCSIMPLVGISGGAFLQNETYVGTGAKLIKSTIVGKGSVIGAGAVINTDIEPNSTYVGVPGKPMLNG